MLRIWLLGPLRLQVNGVDVPPPSSRRARLLLAMLALERRPHSREALAARLWPDVLDESARVSLRTALVRLRSAIGPEADLVLDASRDTVALAGPDQVWTDVGELDRRLQVGEVEAALDLCGEELLTGLEDDWVYERRDELRQRLSDALGRRAGELEAAGGLQAAARLTRRQTEFDPLAEEPHRELVRRLAASGDRAAALGCTKSSPRGCANSSARFPPQRPVSWPRRCARAPARRSAQPAGSSRTAARARSARRSPRPRRGTQRAGR